MKVVGMLKKLTGRSTLGLSKRAAKMIAVKGYTTRISPELREEIRRYYSEENRKLDRLLENSRAN
jgi:hypothetical protein